MSRARNLNSRLLLETTSKISLLVTIRSQLARHPLPGRPVIIHPVDSLPHSSTEGNIPLLIVLTSDRAGKIALFVLLEGPRVKSEALLKRLEPFGLSQCNHLLVPFPRLHGVRSTIRIRAADTRARADKRHACCEASDRKDAGGEIQKGIVEALKSLVNGTGKTL